MKAEIEKINGKWKVVLSHRHQSFVLDFEGTEMECYHLKKMLDKCLINAYSDFFDWFMNRNLGKYNLKTIKEEIVADYLKLVESGDYTL